MTEAEWLACNDPGAMLEHLDGRPSDRRKLRLFAVVCCRRIRHLHGDERSRRAVDIAERFADDPTARLELGGAFDASLEALQEAILVARPLQDARDTPESYRAEAACDAADAACAVTQTDGCSAALEVSCSSRIAAILAADIPGRHPSRDVARAVEDAAHCELLRCIFGNPFRPEAVQRAWLTFEVIDLARGIYEDRAFDRMPVLGDALEEAGCTDEEILAHCRSPTDHARGCWVVDLVLGRV
jgi:hypothetical protein